MTSCTNSIIGNNDTGNQTTTKTITVLKNKQVMYTEKENKTIYQCRFIVSMNQEFDQNSF